MGQVLDAIKVEIAKVIAEGVTEEEMQRAKKSMLSDGFFAQDNQTALARIVGTNLTSGSTLERIKSWPTRLALGHTGSGGRSGQDLFAGATLCNRLFVAS